MLDDDRLDYDLEDVLYLRMSRFRYPIDMEVTAVAKPLHPEDWKERDSYLVLDLLLDDVLREELLQALAHLTVDHVRRRRHGIRCVLECHERLQYPRNFVQRQSGRRLHISLPR